MFLYMQIIVARYTRMFYRDHIEMFRCHGTSGISLKSRCFHPRPKSCSWQRSV